MITKNNSLKCDMCGQFACVEYSRVKFVRDINMDLHGNITDNDHLEYICCRCYENKLADYDQAAYESVIK